MIEEIIKWVIVILMAVAAAGSVGLVESKKRGQREGKLDYYGNPIEDDE